MKENYLTTEGFENFLKLNVFEKGTDLKKLSLSRWEFFDPYSVVFLLLLARQAGLALDFGDKNPALPYLRQIGFFDVDVIARSETTKQSRSDADNILLKITPIEQRRDITEALKRILSSTQTILREHLSYTPEDTSLFLGAFTEVAQNILDHSGDRGLAAAQVYRTKKGVPFAVIAVGDLGMGIRASLSQRYPKKFLNDEIAIRRAFDPAMSRFENRGWGLTQVRSITEKYNGTLWARSGQGLVKFHRQFTSHRTHPFPGTQISIYLEARMPQRRGY